MKIESTAGKGSRTTLVVPVASEATAGSEPVRPRATVSTGVTSAAANAPDSEDQIRIVLADDHAVVRQGLATMLRQEKRFQIIGEASDGKSAVEMVRRLRPDVVVMDISMPGISGIEATRIVHEEFPGVSVIGLSMHDDEHTCKQMCDVGASACLNKSGPVDAIVRAILKCRGMEK